MHPEMAGKRVWQGDFYNNFIQCSIHFLKVRPVFRKGVPTTLCGLLKKQGDMNIKFTGHVRQAFFNAIKGYQLGL